MQWRGSSVPYFAASAPPGAIPAGLFTANAQQVRLGAEISGLAGFLKCELPTSQACRLLIYRGAGCQLLFSAGMMTNGMLRQGALNLTVRVDVIRG
jgi:hypothetical protein